jgi:inosine/xanthosine triphosphate pyrophosphatase family protein
MKSDGVKDVFKWLEQKCKEQKRLVDKAEEYKKANQHWAFFDDSRCIVDDAKLDLALAKERLQAYVDIKIGVEKYMKKLRHQGE